jgi:hypothetical protein
MPKNLPDHWAGWWSGSKKVLDIDADDFRSEDVGMFS